MAITGKKDHGHSLVAATLLISRQFSKRCELGNPYLLLVSVGHLDLSGVWSSVAPRLGTIQTCLKEIGLHAQNMITFLDSKVNIIGGTYMTI